MSDKPYTITEALSLVRHAALEGRKLEAWCAELPHRTFRYDPSDPYSWSTFVNGQREGIWTMPLWNLVEVFGTWHVREVEG